MADEIRYSFEGGEFDRKKDADAARKEALDTRDDGAFVGDIIPIHYRRVWDVISGRDGEIVIRGVSQSQARAEAERLTGEQRDRRQAAPVAALAPVERDRPDPLRMAVEELAREVGREDLTSQLPPLEPQAIEGAFVPTEPLDPTEYTYEARLEPITDDEEGSA